MSCCCHLWIVSIGLVDDALVVVTAGPGTIASCGEDCLICDEPLEVATTYVHATWRGRAGVAHQDCAEPAPTWWEGLSAAAAPA